MGFSVLAVTRVGYIGARTCDNSRRGSPVQERAFQSSGEEERELLLVTWNH